MQDKSIPAGARDFDLLPDSAFIGAAALCTVMDKSRVTIWRMVRDGILPKGRKIGGSGHNRWQVGQIRSLLRGDE